MRTACDGSSIIRPASMKARAWRIFWNSEKDRYREQLERYARLMVQRDDRAYPLGALFPVVRRDGCEWAAPVVLRKQASLFELKSGKIGYVKMQLPTLFHTSGT